MSLKINPCGHYQSLFDKNVKNVQWRESGLFNKMLDKLNIIHMEYTTLKISSKCFKILKLKPKKSKTRRSKQKSFIKLDLK